MGHRPTRRASAIAAAALAALAFTLTGCDYAADPGSSLRTDYLGCGDTSSLVRGCTSGMWATPKIIGDGQAREVATIDVASRSRDGQSASLVSSVTKPSDGWVVWIVGLQTQNLDPASPVMARVWSKEYGGEWFAKRWYLDENLPTRPSGGAASVAPPVARLFSHDSPAAKAPAPVLPTVLDARQSTGTDVTYSWDSNADGVFGDPVQGGWADAAPPAPGTAYVPLATLQSSGLLVPVVRVTDSTGQSNVAQVTLAVGDQGAGGLTVSPSGEQIQITPRIGTLTAHSGPNSVNHACVDVGDDGTYESEPLLYEYWATPARFPSFTTASWSGSRRVRVAFFNFSVDCNVLADGGRVLTSHTELVNGSTKAVMERGEAAVRKGYSARARVRLAGGTTLASGTRQGLGVRGLINRGTFSLKVPARSRRVARPAALAAFSKGAFASSSNASLGFTSTGAASIVGATVMVLRGSGRSLACVRVAQTDSATTWTSLGGTGAARTLRLTMTGGPTLNDVMIKAQPENMPVKGKGTSATRALSPVSTNYAITASAGRARGMTAACRSLVKHLPR